MKPLYITLFVASLFLFAPALADTHDASERVSLALELLDRCESDVCRQVQENGVHYERLLRQAMQEPQQAPRYLEQARVLLSDDIALLERCSEDVCREVREHLRSVRAFIDSVHLDDPLSAIHNTISQIQHALERCETDVCQTVRAHADGRKRLTERAQAQPSLIEENMREVLRIVQDDIALLERCESDVCREVLHLERELFTLVEPLARRSAQQEHAAERVRIQGFESLDVSTSESGIRVGLGGGAGKATVTSFVDAVCPDDRCPDRIHVDFVVPDAPDVVATISPDMYAHDERTEVGVTRNNEIEFSVYGLCQQRGAEIHCDDGSLTVRFERGAEVSCSTRDSELWCWGQNRAGQESQVRFIHGTAVDEGLGVMRSEHTTQATIELVSGEEVFVNAHINVQSVRVSDARCEYGAQVRCVASRGNGITAEDVWMPPTRIGEDRPTESVSLAFSRPGVAAGQGSGRVSVSDITVRSAERDDEIQILSFSWGAHPSRAGHEEEIEVLSWSWGVASSGFTDDDGDSVVLEYTWLVRGNDRPTESLSLNFEKIEFSTVDGGATVSLDFPALESVGNLIHTTITFDPVATRRDGRVCGVTDHLLHGGDCDDTDPMVRPDDPQRGIGIDVDDDGDGIPTQYEPGVARNGRASAALWTGNISRGISPSDISQEDRTRLREELRNQPELRGTDFGLAVALLASENERVRTIRYDEERNVVEVEHEEDMRLFGLFPVRANSKTIVHEDGTEETRRPWWSFLAAKDNNPKFKAGADLSKSVNVVGAYEICPDGTMVESLADCPAHQDAVEAAMNNAPCTDDQILCPDGTCQNLFVMGDACAGHAAEPSVVE